MSAAWLTGPLKRQAGLYRQVALAAALINLFALGVTLFSMAVYDRVIPNNAMHSLAALTAGVGILLASDFLLRRLRAHVLDVAGARVDREVGAAIFARLLKLPSGGHGAGGLAALARECEALREFLSSATLAAIVDLPFVLLFLATIWWLGGSLVLPAALLVALVIAVSLIAQPGLGRLARAALAGAQGHHALLADAMAARETVQATGAAPMLEARFRAASETHAVATLAQREAAALPLVLAGLAQNLAYVGTVAVGAGMVGAGALSMGSLVACSILAGRAVAPLAQIAALLTRIAQARAAWVSLKRIMDTPLPAEAAARAAPIDGEITFEGVSFLYPGAPAPALDRVSFRLRAGERVAILGRSGSGKSTALRLLTGLEPPHAGAVLLDGADIRQYAPADLRRDIGMAPQEVALFAGTLADNITLCRPHVSEAAMHAAAAVAGVSDFARRLPGGWGHVLSERGGGLSGGERQAVALARALAGNPRILVLDEPTAALDTTAEDALIERLAGWVPGRTLLLATHRHALLRLVERVILLDRGRIIADGPRDAVLAKLAAAARPVPLRAGAA